jgi:DNA (cytosine-5)-methyltransferase 1
MEKKIKVGGQFSGVGAFDQALKRLNIPHENVYQAEWDKYARQTYLHNYQEPFIYTKDVNDTPIDLINEKYGSLDLVMFSPPCQAFSLAGKRLGKADKRGILFFNSQEFIQENKPRFFIFENVKGLLSDSRGKTFSEWINMLGGKSVNGNSVLFPYEDSVPYHIYWKVLNAKDFNIPQNRERVFIIGIRDDQDNRFTWPMEMLLQRKLKDVLEPVVDNKYFLSEKLISWILKHREKRESCNKFPLEENGYSSAITSRYYKSGAEDPYIKIKSATKQGYEIATAGDSINFSQINSETRRGRVGKGVAQTLETACNQGVMIGAFRGRNPNNSSDRTLGIKTEQRLEINTNGTSNTLTSVQKDNVVIVHNCITEAIGRQGSSKEYIDSCKKVFESTHQIRRLTPREAFRLMDFPDSFTWLVSDSQAYKQAGNSICVGVLAAIISKLKL